MKPLTSDEFEALSDLGNTNRFQKTRMEEVIAFLESGADAAELKTAGDVTLGRERELYKKALYQLKIPKERVEFLQRKGKLYASRKKTDPKRSTGQCPCCGGPLSNIRTHNGARYRHCFACHKEFPVDDMGFAYRVGGNGK